jgi:integrase
MSVADLSVEQLQKTFMRTIRLLLEEEKEELRKLKGEMKKKKQPKGEGKQAKELSDEQFSKALKWVKTAQHPKRDRVMLHLSRDAGMRACEISQLTWGMVTDPEGHIAEDIHLQNNATKGKSGGRTIPISDELLLALDDLSRAWPTLQGSKWEPDDHVIYSMRGNQMKPKSVVDWFSRIYQDCLGFHGCTSHSGRIVFLTEGACKIQEAGGSLKDVQDLAGHKDLGTTQGYIQKRSEARKNLIKLIAAKIS